MKDEERAIKSGIVVIYREGSGNLSILPTKIQAGHTSNRRREKKFNPPPQKKVERERKRSQALS